MIRVQVPPPPSAVPARTTTETPAPAIRTSDPYLLGLPTHVSPPGGERRSTRPMSR